MEIKLSTFLPRLRSTQTSKDKIYLKNWPHGFGSALLCFIDNAIFFKKYKTTLYPLWIENSAHFKYSDGKNNCFYTFFDEVDGQHSKEEANSQRIILQSDIPMLSGKGMMCITDDNTSYRSYWLERFRIKPIYFDKFHQLFPYEQFTFSIHLRSNFQKQLEYNDNIIPVSTVLKKLQEQYGKDCIPYIATDVTSYLTEFISLFPNAVYLKGVHRVQNENIDSTPYIKQPGIHHGEDLLLDLIGLSRGVNIYMAESNLTILVECLFEKAVSITNIRTLL